ncbi:hypothetical protein Tco_0365301 [Tanacetum coccineum]
MGRTLALDLTGGEDVPENGHDKLFGEDARPRHPSKAPEFRLKWEAAESAYDVAKGKDRTVLRLKEVKFLAISTNDLSEDDAYWINQQKQLIKDKYNLHHD